MKLIEAISHINTVKPNSYSQAEKIRWLSTLDGMVKAQIIDTHEGGENVTFNGYADTTALTAELLIPAPFDEVYINYLEMKIDYSNGEYGKYNNSAAIYNEAYSAFENHYNRTHKPLQKKFTHF